MSRDLIKKQIEKCVRCSVPPIDEDTTSVFIPKNSIKEKLGFKKDGFYLIEIEDYVINPPPGFSLAQNWNGGTNPPNKHMNVCCIQLMGKMVKVDGVAFDVNQGVPLDKVWCGWLPTAATKILKEI